MLSSSISVKRHRVVFYSMGRVFFFFSARLFMFETSQFTRPIDWQLENPLACIYLCCCCLLLLCVQPLASREKMIRSWFNTPHLARLSSIFSPFLRCRCRRRRGYRAKLLIFSSCARKTVVVVVAAVRVVYRRKVALRPALMWPGQSEQSPLQSPSGVSHIFFFLCFLYKKKKKKYIIETCNRLL